MDQSLETDRLVMRRFELDDVPDLFALRSDPTVSQYDSWEPYTSRNEVRQFIESQKHIEPDSEGQWCQWAIVLKSDSRVIGSVEMVIHSRRWGQAETGWALNRAYRGMGYATEAARRMITFGFDDLGLHRIFAECDPGNMASIRLMERLGMRREGHLREIIVVKGEWRDRYVYAVLAHEWDELRHGHNSSPRARRARPGERRATMTESVYKVIELVGTSSESWEKAATAAVERAAQSLRDLRIAEVVELDMQIEDGEVCTYRAKVKVSFKYEEGD